MYDGCAPPHAQQDVRRQDVTQHVPQEVVVHERQADVTAPHYVAKQDSCNDTLCCRTVNPVLVTTSYKLHEAGTIRRAGELCRKAPLDTLASVAMQLPGNDGIP